MINSSAARTFREYNTEQMLIVDSPAKHKFLITKHGEVADGQYLDPKGKLVVQFDHIKQQVVSSRAIASELDASLEPLRGEFEKAFLTYVGQHYPNGAGTVYSKDHQIVACVSSAKFNPGNFWCVKKNMKKKTKKTKNAFISFFILSR
jgi:hypothetical protein